MSETDPHEFLRTDPDLGPLVDEHGELTVEPHPEPFERLVVSIVNQQLSVQSAAAIRERLFDRFEVTPAGLLAADDDALADVGLSGQKIRYVRNVAERFEDGLSVERLHDLDDDAVVAELTEITGIGDWTAKMFLIFCLGREDVFPVEDLGIRRGMEELYGEATRAEMVETAERWHPYRSYASRYLWRVVD
ncbi:DNA-3-methyladenine glycosylase family protein [Haloarchaeobius sp. DYHT-AS-18]|uniref:DNA-3-methyladenine glycosylase family protein n=1 Tax=Haloarchaeobius sp. DYHT-AS-18 TaxID=3446117 RepID=UPI003EB9CE93